MHHGKVDRNTALGLKELKRRIAKAKIPPSRVDESILLATWNMREFSMLGKISQRAFEVHIR